MVLSKLEYSKHRGVSPAMVSHWTKAGRIVIEDGKVNVEASDAALAATLDPARGGGKGNGRANSKRAPAAPVEEEAAPVVDRPYATDAYTRVRTERESFRAKTEQVEYRKMIGELVERRAYDKALADGLGPIVNALDALSARLGHALAAETDVRKVQLILDDAVTTIRQDMADQLRRMMPK